MEQPGKQINSYSQSNEEQVNASTESPSPSHNTSTPLPGNGEDEKGDLTPLKPDQPTPTALGAPARVLKDSQSHLGIPSTPHATRKMPNVWQTPDDSQNVPTAPRQTRTPPGNQPGKSNPQTPDNSQNIPTAPSMRARINPPPLVPGQGPGNPTGRNMPPLPANASPNNQSSTPFAPARPAATPLGMRVNNQPASPNQPGNAGDGANASSVAGTPARRMPPPSPPPLRPSRQRRSRRNLLVPLLVLLALSIVLLALIFGPRVGIAQIFPGSVSAQVSITPDSQLIQNNFLVVGTTTIPDPAKMQVATRLISTQSQPMTATGQSTGSIAATRASGTLTFQNLGGSAVQLNGGTLTGSDGVQISFGPVYVPAAPPAAATATGTALILGTSVNIAVSDSNGT